MNSSTHNTCNTAHAHTQNLVIIGSGAWGSALAINFSALFHKVFLLCHTQAQTKIKIHPSLGVQYPENIELTTDYSCLNDAENILIATPSYAFIDVLQHIKPYIHKQNLAWATKGFASGSSANNLLHQSFNDIFPHIRPCLISGPSFAIEVANFKPTALVVSSPDESVAKTWANLIKSSSIKTYISTDIAGCEVGGAVKNILAIAAGISSGLGFGVNTMSALITRGLAEITRFGVSLGGQKHTFTGLSGLGDLTLTCLDDKSRNRSFGKFLAQCGNKNNALDAVGATVEGLNALPVVLEIAKKNNIKMPICFAVDEILRGQTDMETIVKKLMQGGGYYE